MNKCDGCVFDDTCVNCNDFDCEELEALFKQHDKQIREEAIDEFMDKLPYSALVRMSTLKKIAEQLKENNNDN